MARARVTLYGMSERFGLMGLVTIEDKYLEGRASLNCGEETAAQIDQEVMKILKDSYDEAVRLLQENREILNEISEYLYEHETITGKEFMKIFRQLKGIPDETLENTETKEMVQEDLEEDYLEEDYLEVNTLEEPLPEEFMYGHGFQEEKEIQIIPLDKADAWEGNTAEEAACQSWEGYRNTADQEAAWEGDHNTADQEAAALEEYNNTANQEETSWADDDNTISSEEMSWEGYDNAANQEAVSSEEENIPGAVEDIIFLQAVNIAPQTETEAAVEEIGAKASPAIMEAVEEEPVKEEHVPSALEALNRAHAEPMEEVQVPSALEALEALKKMQTEHAEDETEAEPEVEDEEPEKMEEEPEEAEAEDYLDRLLKGMK